MATGTLRGMTRARRDEELARRFARIDLAYVSTDQSDYLDGTMRYWVEFRAPVQGDYAGTYQLDGVTGWDARFRLDSLEAVTADPAVLLHACWSARWHRHLSLERQHEASKDLGNALEAYGRHVARDLHLKLDPRVRGRDKTPATRTAGLRRARALVVERAARLAAIRERIDRIVGPEPIRPLSPYERETGIRYPRLTA